MEVLRGANCGHGDHSRAFLHRLPLMLLFLALRHWHIGLPLAAVVFICLVWQPFSTGFGRGWRRGEAERGVPHMSLGDRLGAAPGWFVEGFRQGYDK